MATVAEARTQLELRKRDLTDVSNATFIQWADQINKFAYRIIVGTDPGRFMSTSSYTVVSSPSTQTLPADFFSIQTSDTGFFFVDGDGEQQRRRLPRTGFGSQLPGYYIDGTDVVFTGIEKSDGQVFTLRYTAQTADLTATTDSFIIPDEYSLYLVNALDARYAVWDEDVSAEGFADARFARALDELLRNIRKEPGSYSQFDFTFMY